MSEYKTNYVNNYNQIEELNKVKEVDGLPSVKIINKGVVLPRNTSGSNIPYQGLGGVVSEDGIFVDESYIYDLNNENDENVHIAFGGAYNYKIAKEDKKKVIYLGLAHQQWGHFLIDVIQRCWYIISNDISNDYLFVFSGFGDGKTNFGKNYRSFFELLGIDTNKILIINEPTQFLEIIVPNVAIYPGEKVYSIYRKIIDKAIANAEKEYGELIPYHDIYFSRLHLNDVKEIGEKELEKSLCNVGAKILYPEELSLVEQIFYWQNADRVQCIMGTIPHNCIFAKDGLELIIYKKMDRLVGYQFTMERIRNIKSVYVDSYYEPFSSFPIDVSRGPFWINITNYTKKFFRDYYGTDVAANMEIKNWFRYLLVCFIARFKYTFRGSGFKIKKLVQSIKQNRER